MARLAMNPQLVLFSSKYARVLIGIVAGYVWETGKISAVGTLDGRGWEQEPGRQNSGLGVS